MSEPILHVKHLKKTYGNNVVALKGIDLELFEGEFVVVIGPSGAGKSTLMRCINQLVKPSSGEIHLKESRIDTLKGQPLRGVRSQIGMIFQHYNLVGRTNVLKNVLYGLLGQMNIFESITNQYSEESRKAAIQLLNEVGLEDKIYQRADELSGGQKQRVGICRALIQDPVLMLADEPIASLDPKSADIVMQSLHDIAQKKQLSVLVNLHQVDYAVRYASRIIGLKNGKIVFNDVPEKLSQAMIDMIYEGKEEMQFLTQSVSGIA